MQQFVVGGIVQDGGDVQLLKRPADDFMGGIYELPPAARSRPGEALDSALVREVKEETGLEVAEIGAYIGSFDDISGSGKLGRQVNFVLSVAASEPVALQEHDEFTWASLDADLPVTDAVKQVFTAYRELDSEQPTP